MVTLLTFLDRVSRKLFPIGISSTYIGFCFTDTSVSSILLFLLSYLLDISNRLGLDLLSYFFELSVITILIGIIEGFCVEMSNTIWGLVRDSFD